MRGSLAWRIFFGVVLLAGVSWVVLHRAEGAELLALARNARPWWMAVGLAFQVATYPADGMVWERVVARLGEKRLGTGNIARLSLAKFFVDQFVPVGGVGGTFLVVRSLQKHGVSRHGAMVALVARLVSYYFAYAIALAAAIAIAWFVADEVPRVVLAVASALAFAFLFGPSSLLWLLRHPERRLPRYLLRSRRLQRMRGTMETMIRAAPAVGRDRWMLVECTAWQLAIFLLDGATLWATLHAVGAPTPFPVGYAGFLLGFLAGSLTGVPAGVGVVEAGTVASLALFGVPGAAALAATLLFRGLSLWLPLLPGAFFARRESWR